MSKRLAAKIAARYWWTLAGAWCIFATAASADPPIVWTGLDVSFTKVPGQDPLLPANEDRLSAHVALARADIAGLFNALEESSFDRDLRDSPLDTEWATSINNPTQTISATNWAALSFSTWNASFGGMGGVGTNILNHDAVVHLITDNIYLDLRFIAWGGNQGGFSYLRSAPPTTGDYNGDHVVDAADYTVWRDTLGHPTVAGTGADGNGSAFVDASDYDVWKAKFGNVVPDAVSGGAATVPEPATPLLAAIAVAYFIRVRSLRRKSTMANWHAP
jgi:hypothetical protein